MAVCNSDLTQLYMQAKKQLNAMIKPDLRKVIAYTPWQNT